mmetsp:Transcript_30231/g.93553  ORF Transcript_30231/g.93553 Transcript_30231/m.93553 type:complete len:89 (+) Transcript_30231:274-540(+)
MRPTSLRATASGFSRINDRCARVPSCAQRCGGAAATPRATAPAVGRRSAFWCLRRDRIRRGRARKARARQHTPGTAAAAYCIHRELGC